MASIYKITNKINNKVYIGKTNNSIQQRFKEHIRDSKKHSNRPLYRAFNKYGIDNFTISMVEECNPEVAAEREIYWINYYKSFHNGYNATLGGDGTVWLDYDLIYETYLQTKNVTETAAICGCCKDSVRFVLEEKGISCETLLENNRKARSKAVLMLDKENNPLRTFNSLSEAALFIGKGTSSHIQAACSGKRKTAYGYKWKYL